MIGAVFLLITQSIMALALVASLLAAIKEVVVKWRETGSPAGPASYTWRRLIAVALANAYIAADARVVDLIAGFGTSDPAAAITGLVTISGIRAVVTGALLFMYFLGPTMEQLSALAKGLSGISLANFSIPGIGGGRPEREPYNIPPEETR